MRQTTITAGVLIAAIVCWPAAARAGELRVLPNALWLLEAFDEGQRTSKTFRTLLEAIEASDLVVYARGVAGPDRSPAAYVTFISRAAGRRYIMLNVSTRAGGSSLPALVGHELQHVREIAEHPEIVDARSFEDFYQEFGFSPGPRGPARVYDSSAAVEAGARIRDEVASALAADDR